MFRRVEKIRPVGRLDQAAVSELSGHCREQAGQGNRRAMVLDLAAVSDCDLAGLLGLAELAQGWCGLPVRVRGARWSQFLLAIQAVGLGEVSETRNRIRVLVHPQPAVAAAPRSGSRSRPTAASRP